MLNRKQCLLKRHRQQKRWGLGLFALLTLASAGVSLWLPPVLLLLGWIAHEAWLADHLFYSPKSDYQYRFPESTPQFQVRCIEGVLQVEGDWPNADTLILSWSINSSFWGWLRDPQVWLGEDRQDFERGARGVRYLNLSGQQQALREGRLKLSGRFCSLADTGTLYTFQNPDYTQQRLLIIAPHADDAELAAFGLYSRAKDVHILTLTQGEIEAKKYQRLGLDTAQAAQLKGRLRTWDSLAIPLWGGVPQQRCLQLGYYCLRLPAMLAEPDKVFGSLESGAQDTSLARRYNAYRLPGDTGQPTGHHLLADLKAILEQLRPQVVITPHPELDPHTDHIAATHALLQAMESLEYPPWTLLLYANHLHDNDRWPMGPADGGIALPPSLEPLPADGLWSPVLDPQTRHDKAQALAMQHDLQGKVSLKHQVRRWIQAVLTGRRWPITGENEFFRKAVRRHEVFWVRSLSPPQAHKL
ncbi:LmbE family N-acetylglucosaminyl deacetylase [Azomonas agilis]|uniref:LmbE family N-acetylglucosaminyl deacetylase n=1 Tax=Azomonas agilis TaxID=116849 RepID=A0A562I1M1_9GAMM|nr:PIG-L family deacetylase [Azomonas agilis]TWH64553.1 LmbE family N-acetylglucosaminyl deacetylase [Azomonas agilis]